MRMPPEASGRMIRDAAKMLYHVFTITLYQNECRWHQAGRDVIAALWRKQERPSQASSSERTAKWFVAFPASIARCIERSYRVITKT
jgi:hypothetical protein